MNPFKSISIVDFDQFENRIEEIANEIDIALHTTGFVYVKNAGIPQNVVKNAFIQNEAFFTQEIAVKDHYKKKWNVNSTSYEEFTGYTRAGLESEGESDYEHKESFDLCGSSPIYPSSDFRDAFIKLEAEAKKLTLKLARILGISLGISNPYYFVERLQHLKDSSVPNTTTLRPLYYPPVTEDAVQLKHYKNPTRCSSHTDYGFITLLFMENNATGLEVQPSFSNEWIPAPPIDGTVLINVADFLELWSDGYYKATLHRVQLPSNSEQMGRSRKTIAYFVNPDDNVNVKALKTKHNQTNVCQRLDIWNSYNHIMNRCKNAYGIA